MNSQLEERDRARHRKGAQSFLAFSGHKTLQELPCVQLHEHSFWVSIATSLQWHDWSYYWPLATNSAFILVLALLLGGWRLWLKVPILSLCLFFLVTSHHSEVFYGFPATGKLINTLDFKAFRNWVPGHVYIIIPNHENTLFDKFSLLFAFLKFWLV